MQLMDFFDYKNQLMGDMLTSKEIVELLNDSLDMKDAETLRNTQIFPYEYFPEINVEADTIVFFDVDVTQSLDKTFYEPTLYIWVMSHKSQLYIEHKGVRTDLLCSEICKKINGSRKYGLGELSLYSVKRFAPLSNYDGKVMTFHMRDFSKTHDRKPDIPANRKRG